MKVITEAIVRDELRASHPAEYEIPKGKILSPAAREYLQQCKIRIVDGRERARQPQAVREEAKPVAEPKKCEPQAAGLPRYVDDVTGAFYYEKPEHMTQITGDRLVSKDDKRIVFRGKLDSLEALFVLNQALLAEMGESQEMLSDLEDILVSLREMMRCDVRKEPLSRETIIGLSHAELREHSHHPMKYYNVKQMVLPNYKFGRVYAMLNQMRTAVRETEVAAVAAFHNGKGCERTDIIEELNRISSAMHVLMCKYLAKAQG